MRLRRFGAIEVAAGDAQDFRRSVGAKRLVAGNAARKHIVDDDRRNGGEQAERSGEQRFGDAGRDDGEIGGVLPSICL